MKFTKYLISVVLTAQTAIAVPAVGLGRRVSQNVRLTIGDGFTDEQKTQINDGVDDALTLARAAWKDMDNSASAIYKRYFSSDDIDTVKQVYEQILDGQPGSGQDTGNALLSKITVVKDYPDGNGDMACDGYTMAEMRRYNTDTPQLIIYDAGFDHGGINKGYHCVGEVSTDYLDDRVSWKMETLGSVLLHEFTHYKNLVVPPLSKETDDDHYCLVGSRDIQDKKEALNNADSYSWYANELFWSDKAQKTFNDPVVEDSIDPRCLGP